jgi:hypothetical protein
MAVYRNVAVPLGFAFGVAETVELYDQYYGAFAQLFCIELQKYILDLDQGSALSALCKLKEQRQLFCLGHFLLSSKNKEFSLAVGNLVKCRTEAEFVALRSTYEGEFVHVVGLDPEQPRRKLLLQTLKKAALTYGEGKRITVEDKMRWEAISMWGRVVTRMPRTTNSLEAIVCERSIYDKLSKFHLSVVLHFFEWLFGPR